MTDALPTTPIERPACTIAWLCGFVAEQGGRKQFPGLLVRMIWTRLQRISARFLAVAAAEPRPAGAPAPAPAPARRLAAPARHPGAPDPAPQIPGLKPCLPGGIRRPLRPVPSATASLSQLERLLRDRKTIVLLAADSRLGRIQRPPRSRRTRSVAAAPAFEPATAPEAAPAFRARPVEPPPRARIVFGARDPLTKLRMGPSLIWD